MPSNIPVWIFAIPFLIVSTLWIINTFVEDRVKGLMTPIHVLLMSQGGWMTAEEVYYALKDTLKCNQILVTVTLEYLVTAKRATAETRERDDGTSEKVWRARPEGSGPRPDRGRTPFSWDTWGGVQPAGA